jgi:hypothetical protein
LPPFKLTTSPGPIERICNLVDQLVREIQGQGWILQKQDTEAWRLIIQGEEISISFHEQTERVAHIPTKQELRYAAEYSWRKIPEFDHMPSGLLKLTITNASYCSATNKLRRSVNQDETRPQRWNAVRA